MSPWKIFLTYINLKLKKFINKSRFFLSILFANIVVSLSCISPLLPLFNHKHKKTRILWEPDTRAKKCGSESGSATKRYNVSISYLF